MPRHHHAWLAAVLLGALAPAHGGAQSSPYLPLDDPRLPPLEHLIARGDIADPSPMVRPFTRADALRDRLAELGILLEDTPAGPRWKRSAGT